MFTGRDALSSVEQAISQARKDERGLDAAVGIADVLDLEPDLELRPLAGIDRRRRGQPRADPVDGRGPAVRRRTRRTGDQSEQQQRSRHAESVIE